MELLFSRAAEDRSGEWFTREMLPDIGAEEGAGHTPVIIRRARAFGKMLEVMADAENSKFTHTYDIRPGELIVGTMPLGSLGLGKVFPNYLTEREKEVAFFSSRSIDSVLAHNVPDFSRVLRGGLEQIIDLCDSRLESLTLDYDYPIGARYGMEKKIHFYQAVQICCQSVIDYAEKFADLAQARAENEADPQRKIELLEVARICRKVPREPADGFYEALHSIWIVHLALHASASHLSLGRLDQLLEPYLAKSLADPQEYAVGGRPFSREIAQELFECFLIKSAERMMLNPTNLVVQDHADFATGMGANPFLVDQEATVNQFMQNIVIGGLTPQGADATNDCTYLILDACTALGLPTPVLNVRLHAESPRDLFRKTAESAVESGNGQPIVYNDDSIIPGMSRNPKIPLEEARDYVVDGCWETLLNAKCDFNYNMVNMLSVLEYALNGGAEITDSLMQLRGPKKSFLTPPASEIKSFEQLKELIAFHLRYVTNKAGMELYSHYMLESSTTPTPFFSALLGNCLEKGIDKTWGGADYILSGMVFIAMPNVANALAAIQKWVFQGEYELEEVVAALKNNFKDETQKEILAKLSDSPQFGNGDKTADGIMRWLMDTAREAVVHAEELCDQVFVERPETEREMKRIERLRHMAGYAGENMKKRYGENFSIAFSAGCGTFAQYVHFGGGCGASADGRMARSPVASNFSPISGTANGGAGAVLDSLKGLGLGRFGLGVMVDLCFDQTETSPDYMEELLRKFIFDNGSIVSLTVLEKAKIIEAHEICNLVRDGRADSEELAPYNHIAVRAGGWNSPFVALTRAQQEDYIRRVLPKV